MNPPISNTTAHRAKFAKITYLAFAIFSSLFLTLVSSGIFLAATGLSPNAPMADETFLVQAGFVALVMGSLMSGFVGAAYLWIPILKKHFQITKEEMKVAFEIQDRLPEGKSPIDIMGRAQIRSLNKLYEDKK